MNRRAFLKTAGAVAALGALPSIGRAQAKEVKLGYILPVTGPLAFEAQLSLNGLQLAVDEINNAGGVKSLVGAKLTLLSGDTQNKVELGNSEAARLIDQGISALIGPFSSLVAYSVRQVPRRTRRRSCCWPPSPTTSPRAGSSTSSACSPTARPWPRSP